MTPLVTRIAGQKFSLHPLAAAYWEEQDMLLLADVHLGKAGHFRKAGMPIPQTGILKDYEHLDILCETYNPGTICFLGDLFHSSINKEFDLFAEWSCAATSRLVLVSGNHDIIADVHYEKLGIEIMEEWTIDNFHLTHEPQDSPGLINMAGHIHPGIELNGRGRDRMRLPIFHLNSWGLLFPAFGSMTGLYCIQPQRGDRVFVLAGEQVVEMD